MAKKSKSKHDPDAPFFKGMTIRQFLEIIVLATANTFDWTVYSKAKVRFGVREQTPNIWNDFTAGQYIIAELPLLNKTGEYTQFGFEVKLYDDGYFLFENGSGCQIRHSNPLQVHALVAKYLSPEVTKQE